MMSGEQPLPLRDIHLPTGVEWFPPAPGWWVVAAIFLGLTALLVFWHWRRYRRNRFIREAQALLAALLASAGDRSTLQQVDEIAALLRRVAISRYGRHEVAGYTGDAWLQFLDNSGKTRGFTQGPGRILGPIRFRPDPAVDVNALATLASEWIRSQRW
jgi:hypothetical protein